MPAVFPPQVEPLTRRHQREGFDCGEPALNEYLARQALQDMGRGVSRVFVARPSSGQNVLGYYTLSAASFRKHDLPSEQARRLPHYPVPAAILGRLAIDQSTQGQGLGKYLLIDAFHRVLQASETLAVYAIVVDAKNDKARAFYKRYGFIGFPQTPSRLFIPLETVRRGLGES